MKLTRAIRRARREGKVPLIAEIKLRSPTDGDLLRGRDPLQIADKYVRGGACAISVVTEPVHFGGDMLMLKRITSNVGLPVLRKDFIGTEEQVLESRQSGARAVLLISAMLSRQRLANLNEYAHSLGLETVVEIHRQEELRNLEGLRLDMVGINNKDILNLERGEDQIVPTQKLVSFLPKGVVVISESGIGSEEDVRGVISAGADAVLIGRALLKTGDIRAKVGQVVWST
jgi:indole-3-glycerol phosphate synthase